MMVECQSCGKKFNAPESMAGKRVRCRGCGEVFAVPVGDVSPARVGGASEGGVDLSALRSFETSFNRPEVEIEESGVEEQPKGRINEPLDFPNAHLLDSYLPYALLIIAVGWTILENLQPPTEEVRPGWVPFLRIGIFWVIYTAVVWPITIAGSLAGGRKSDVQPPPSHAWRVFTTFAFPSVLGYVLWSIIGTIAGFVTGMIVGLGISLGVHFLLYRLQPKEAAKALPIVAAHYAGSLVAGAVVLVGLNFALQTILTAARTAHEYATSPMGQYLPWNPPTPEVRPQPKPVVVAKTPVTIVQPDAAPTATQPAEPAPVVKDVSPSSVLTPEPTKTVEVPKPPDAAQPAPAPSPVPNPIASAGNTTPAPVPTPKRDLFDDDTPDPVGKRPEAVTIPGEQTFDRINASALVERSVELTELGAFSEVIMPMVPSRFVAAVRHVDAVEDAIDVWNLAPVEKKGTATFRKDAGVDPGYLLSPDGKLVTRVATFPSLSVQVWSVSESRIVRSIQLNKSLGTPTPLTFADNTQFWILWERMGIFGLEGWDAQTGARLRPIELGGYDRSPANFAISADGKYAAMMRSAGIGKQGELHVLNLKTGGAVKRFSLSGIDRDLIVQPAGIAFTPDASKVALLVDHNDQGLLLAWNVTGGDVKPICEHLFPGGFLGDKSIKRLRTRSIDWLADGSAFLINGTGVYSAADGRELGSLGVEKVTGQRVVDSSTVELVSINVDRGVASRAANSKIYVLKLKPIGKETEATTKLVK